MTIRYSFDGIGNEFAARERIFHAVMAHGNAVTDGDGRKFNGHAACFGHTHLHSIGNFPQVHMAGYDFVEGIDNANHGTLQFFIGVAHGMEQAAVGRTLGSFFCDITSHDTDLSFITIGVQGNQGIKKRPSS